MIGLADLQRDFQRYLLGLPHDMLAHVRDSSKADAATLLDVYGQAYALRLVEVLRNDYPGLHGFLGEAAFDALARAYLAAYPSRDPNARWFGRHLPAFAKDVAPWSGQPVIGDLAALDWAVGEAFDAAAVPLLAFGDLVAVAPMDWPELRFAVVPSARRLELTTNADDIRRAATALAPLPAAMPLAASRPLLVWRRGLEPETLVLEPDAATAFDALAVGERFGRICEMLAEFHPEEVAAMRAAGLLRAWIELELLAIPTP